jgi:hypothetical protein
MNVQWMTGRWKAELLRVLGQEFPNRKSDYGCERSDVFHMLNSTHVLPAGWRIQVEDRAEGWGHKVVVIEMLVLDEDITEYAMLWFDLDCTEIAHARLYRPDETTGLTLIPVERDVEPLLGAALDGFTANSRN